MFFFILGSDISLNENRLQDKGFKTKSLEIDCELLPAFESNLYKKLSQNGEGSLVYQNEERLKPKPRNSEKIVSTINSNASYGKYQPSPEFSFYTKSRPAFSQVESNFVNNNHLNSQENHFSKGLTHLQNQKHKTDEGVGSRFQFFENKREKNLHSTIGSTQNNPDACLVTRKETIKDHRLYQNEQNTATGKEDSKNIPEILPLKIKKLAPFDLSLCTDQYVSDVKVGPFFEDSLEDYDAMKLEEHLDSVLMENISGNVKKHRRKRHEKGSKALFTKNKGKNIETAGVPEIFAPSGLTCIGGPYTIDQGKASTPALFSEDELTKQYLESLSISKKEGPQVVPDPTHEKRNTTERKHRRHHFTFKSKRKDNDDEIPPKEVYTTLAFETILSKLNKSEMFEPTLAVSQEGKYNYSLDLASPSLFSEFEKSKSNFNSLSFDLTNELDFIPTLPTSGNLASPYNAPSPVILSSSLDKSASSGFETVYCLDYITPQMEDAARKANFSSTLYGPKAEEDKWTKKEDETRKAALTGKLGVKVITNRNTGTPSRLPTNPKNYDKSFYLNGDTAYLEDTASNRYDGYLGTTIPSDIGQQQSFTKNNKVCGVTESGLEGLRGMGTTDGLVGLSDTLAYGDYYSKYGKIGLSCAQFSDVDSCLPGSEKLGMMQSQFSNDKYYMTDEEDSTLKSTIYKKTRKGTEKSLKSRKSLSFGFNSTRSKGSLSCTEASANHSGRINSNSSDCIEKDEDKKRHGISFRYMAARHKEHKARRKAKREAHSLTKQEVKEKKRQEKLKAAQEKKQKKDKRNNKSLLDREVSEIEAGNGIEVPDSLYSWENQRLQNSTLNTRVYSLDSSSTCTDSDSDSKNDTRGCNTVRTSCLKMVDGTNLKCLVDNDLDQMNLFDNAQLGQKDVYNNLEEPLPPSSNFLKRLFKKRQDCEEEKVVKNGQSNMK